MGNKKQTYQLKIQIHTSDEDYNELEEYMRIFSVLRSSCLKYVKKKAKFIMNDAGIKDLIHSYREKKEERAEILESFDSKIGGYGVGKPTLVNRMWKHQLSAFSGEVEDLIVWKLAEDLYYEIRKAILLGKIDDIRDDTEINSFDSGERDVGIEFDRDAHRVSIMGGRYKLEPIPKDNTYMEECFEDKLLYCRVVREPNGKRNKYFLVLVMEGTSPKNKCKTNKNNNILFVRSVEE